MIKIRKFKDNDLRDMLDLSQRSDSTTRYTDTWQGNNMVAVLAFDEDKLIGAIPFEPRIFTIGAGKMLKILWISGAHIDATYRSQGIGTMADNHIKEAFYPEYMGVFAYREDEGSAAYRWYKKLGYQALLPITSFKKQVERPNAEPVYVLLQDRDEIKRWQSSLYECFKKHTAMYGGFSKRHKQFWEEKFETHDYKKFYTYSMLLLLQRDSLIAYALLGETDMRDGISRFDILEMILPDDEKTKERFYNAVMHHAWQKKLKEVRIQVSSQDPHIEWIMQKGFTHRWRTNVIGKLFNPVKNLEERIVNNAKVFTNYQISIQTPQLATLTIGQGTKKATVFLQDTLLSEMILGRCNIADAIREGKIVVLEGGKEILNVFDSLFPMHVWQYFHIDHI